MQGSLFIFNFLFVVHAMPKSLRLGCFYLYKNLSLRRDGNLFFVPLGFIFIILKAHLLDVLRIEFKRSAVFMMHLIYHILQVVFFFLLFLILYRC